MNKFIFITFILFIFSYSCTTKNIEGYYQTKYKYGTIELKKDSTYYLQSGGGYHLKRSFGSWSIIDKRMILLKSKYQEKQINCSIQYLNNEPNDSFCIEVNPVIHNSLRDEFLYELIVNDSTCPKKHCYSNLFIVKSQEINKVSIKFISESALHQKYDTITSNVFKINNSYNKIRLNFEANVELFNYVVINEKIKIAHNKMKVSNVKYKKPYRSR